MVKIGNIELPPFPLLLAPMEDVSDPPFRALCKEQGADVVYTEFISSEGFFTSPTQPFSVGMPSFAKRLTEADMWGITPFDQAACRLQFKRMRYEGPLTPPTTGYGSLYYPGVAGGMNWGVWRSMR